MQHRSDKSRVTSSGLSSDIYLYQMPAQERELVCQILDQNDVWRDLALNHMGYTKTDLQEIKRQMQLGNSPADELLTMWGDQNHTVTELFVLLSRIQQYWAMDVIKNLVDRRYHRLMNSGQPRISILMGEMGLEQKTPVTEEQNGAAARKSTNVKILNCPLISNENNEEQEGAASAGVAIKNFSDYASTIPQIDYQELVEATNGWSDKSILGKGGFGTVYKGMWKFTAVAIKKIEYRGTGDAEANKVQMQQSLNELRYLNSCRHDNILPLYGYSINGDEPCLVYQLMSGGSLEQRLFSKQQEPLSWSQRINIANGTARGLQYLHTVKEKPLIHGDIKPANILLDPCCQPRIGDFGLAREGPKAEDNSMEVSRVYGTKPYLPAEFLVSRSLSTKVDTFSYGVVLFELVTGLRAYDHKRSHKFLTKHIMSACAENVSIGLNCYTPNLSPGNCEAFQSCQSLLELLQQYYQTADTRIANYIQSSFCQQNAYTINVCCPIYGGTSTSNTLIFYDQSYPQYPQYPNTQYPNTQYPNTQYPQQFPQFPQLFPQYPYSSYPSSPFQGLRQGISGDASQCGVFNATFNRVVGGENAPIGAWPWMALLGYRSSGRQELSFVCAGSLITQNHVLTAAHCIQDSLVLVRLGEYDLSTNTEGATQDIDVAKKIVHQEFQAKNILSDIALLRLAQAATLSDRVSPVCLPTEMNLRQSDLTYYQPFVAGWGATSYKGPSANILQQAQVPILPTSDCETNYKSNFPTLVFDERVLCAGWPSGGKDACTGDSGAGLYLPQLSTDKTFYYYSIVGIVSYGYECATPGFPGVYTRITSFLTWINDHLDD